MTANPTEPQPILPVEPDTSAQIEGLEALKILAELQNSQLTMSAPSQSRQLLHRHAAKFVSFGAIGGAIFIAGLALQAALTSGLHIPSFISYLVQAFLSVEASFLLNRWITWRGVKTAFWRALGLFNAQKVITVTVNALLYAGLLKLGMNYLLDNVLLTAIFTMVNYVGADRFVFLQSGLGTPTATVVANAPPRLPVNAPVRRLAPRPRAFRRELPTVSVVIPCRGNEMTIRAAVDSIFGQDYPQLRELILVGSPGDTTWRALENVSDPRLVVLETETPSGIRDANFKRDFGICQTSGDLISLIDSDMVIPSRWLSNAVRLLIESESDCVAGVMRSIRDDFWGRFVDRNCLGAKTPRAQGSYLVTAENFGAGSHKPPITADILFTKKMYERCPIDSSWSHGSLEDYEWFWRVVKSGHQVLVSDQIFGWHHHRSGLKKLSAEYRRSARGCAFFIRAHSNSPFARKRLAQAVALPSILVLASALLVGAVIAGHGRQAIGITASLAVLACLCVCGTEFLKGRTYESLAYPFPALILGVNYTASLVTHLVGCSSMHAVTSKGTSLPSPVSNVKRSAIRRYFLHPLSLMLALQAALSLSLVWSNTAFNDEADYLWVGGTLLGHIMHGAAWPSQYAHTTLSGLPFLYPPLGAAANIVGGLAGARILSLIFMMCATACVYAMANRLYGRTCAACSSALFVTFSPVIQLGAFATYDALSVALTACAAWLALKAGYARKRAELVAMSAAVLAIAEVTAYSGVVMIPVVVAFVYMAWLPRMGAKQATFCTAWFTAVCIAVFCVIMTLAKTWPGIIGTVLSRQITSAGYASPIHVFDDSWTYSGIIAMLALVGAVYALTSLNRVNALQVVLLAVIAFVVPLAQAHDTTAVSLKKHLAYGAVFAVIAAGYGLEKISKSLPRHRVAAAVCYAAVFMLPVVNGFQESQNWYHTWPNQSSLMARLEPMLSSRPGVTISIGGGDYLCDYYYADSGSDWQRCRTNLTIADVRRGDSRIIVLGYPASVTPPNSIPSRLLLSPKATQADFLNYLTRNSSGSKVQNSAELNQITLALSSGANYKLVATGPYDSNQNTGIYTIWIRNTSEVRGVVRGGNRVKESQ